MTRAWAIRIRWRWPPENARPASVMNAARPIGIAATSASRPASRAASHLRLGVNGEEPMMFWKRLPGSRLGVSSTRADLAADQARTSRWPRSLPS